MATRTKSRVALVAAWVLLVGAVVGSLLSQGATAAQPAPAASPTSAPTSSGGISANKFAASGSTEEVFGPGDNVPILSEQVKIPTNHELALSVSLECSIITSLHLGDSQVDDSTDTDQAEGGVVIWIEIDGHRVPVTSSGFGDDDAGEVTFCNTFHQQRVTDSEDNGANPDGIDTHDDYLRTKNANGFNWFALNVGNQYDSPSNGNNVVDVVVYARLIDNHPANDVNGAHVGCNLGDRSCSEAIIGNRTLIVEPTHASVTEVVEPAGPGNT
jgi:hypothetical protein